MDSGMDSLAAVEFRNRLSNELQGTVAWGWRFGLVVGVGVGVSGLVGLVWIWGWAWNWVNYCVDLLLVLVCFAFILPGVKLPNTLIFDYPTVSAISNLDLL